MVRIKIDSSRCKGCKLCMEVCPRHCLVLAEELNARGVHAVVFDDADVECSACGSCFLICPDAAIEIIEDEEDDE